MGKKQQELKHAKKVVFLLHVCNSYVEIELPLKFSQVTNKKID